MLLLKPTITGIAQVVIVLVTVAVTAALMVVLMAAANAQMVI